MSINRPCKFQEHWKQGKLLNRASKRSNFLPRLEFTSERPHYFKYHLHVHDKSKTEFASKRTLGYSPKKSPGYANDRVKKRSNITHWMSRYNAVWCSHTKNPSPEKRKAAILLNNCRGKKSSSSDGEAPIISIFRKFLRKVIESSVKCKLFFFVSCARANETWKQCPWIMKTITC